MSTPVKPGSILNITLNILLVPLYMYTKCNTEENDTLLSAKTGKNTMFCFHYILYIIKVIFQVSLVKVNVRVDIYWPGYAAELALQSMHV